MKRAIVVKILLPVIAALASFSQPLPAQAPAPPAGAETVAPNTSNLLAEWGIVIVGAGVALFAVCRSSRRN